jgi:hypothetical protein
MTDMTTKATGTITAGMTVIGMIATTIDRAWYPMHETTAPHSRRRCRFR